MNNKEIAKALKDNEEALLSIKKYLKDAGYSIVCDNEGLYHIAFTSSCTGHYEKYDDIYYGGDWETPDPDADVGFKGWKYISSCFTEDYLLQLAFKYLMLKDYK